jgi:hypothetical protein
LQQNSKKRTKEFELTSPRFHFIFDHKGICAGNLQTIQVKQLFKLWILFLPAPLTIAGGRGGGSNRGKTESEIDIHFFDLAKENISFMAQNNRRLHYTVQRCLAAPELSKSSFRSRKIR